MRVQIVHETLQVVVGDRVGEGSDVLLLPHEIPFRLVLRLLPHGQDDACQIPRFRVDRQRIAVHGLLLDLVDVILESGGERKDQSYANDADGPRERGQNSAPLLGHQIVQAKAEGCRQGHRSFPEVLVDGRFFVLDREGIGVIRYAAVLEAHDAVGVLLRKLGIVRDHDDQAVVGHFF